MSAPDAHGLGLSLPSHLTSLGWAVFPILRPEAILSLGAFSEKMMWKVGGSCQSLQDFFHNTPGPATMSMLLVHAMAGGEVGTAPSGENGSPGSTLPPVDSSLFPVDQATAASSSWLHLLPM